jgi:FMN phosphatase YigB (HAD superfamily)
MKIRLGNNDTFLIYADNYLFMKIASVDLDDTLIRTGVDYYNANEELAEFANNTFDLDPSKVRETQKEIDSKQLNDLGLSLKRFPTSFRKTIEQLAASPTEEQLEYAEELGWGAYKTKDEYSRKGFIDGAEEMLNRLEKISTEMHLITAGVPKLQQRKINALNLESKFDRTHIVPMDTKCETLMNISQNANVSSENVFHIGNSEESDVKAALRANTNAVYLPSSQWRGTSGKEYTGHDSVHVFSSHREFLESPLLDDKNT